VTGVACFLGSHLAEHFVRAGCSVAGIDNLLGGAKEHVPADVEFVVADCANREANAGLLDGVRIAYRTYAGAATASTGFVGVLPTSAPSLAPG
jgi:UDP-glucose 4-epimerase